MNSFLDNQPLDSRTNLNRSLLSLLEDKHEGVEAHNFANYVKDRLKQLNVRIKGYTPVNFSGKRAEKERMQIFKEIKDLGKMLKLARMHPDIMRKTPEELFAKSLELLKRQRKHLEQKSLQILGYKISPGKMPSGQNKHFSRNRESGYDLNETAKTSKRPQNSQYGLGAKIDMNETKKRKRHPKGDDESGALNSSSSDSYDINENSSFQKKRYSKSKYSKGKQRSSGGSYKRYGDEEEGFDEDGDISNFSERLKDVESKYELVTSLYKEMNDMEDRQKEKLEGINSKLDVAVKRIKKSKENVKETHQAAIEGRVNIPRVIFMGVVLSALAVALLIVLS